MINKYEKEVMGILDDIKKAMASKNVISFHYTDSEGVSGVRTVEPHLVGKTKKGVVMLSAYQVKGVTQDAGHLWKQYNECKIVSLEILDQTFTQTRLGYNSNDSRYPIILVKI